MTLHFNMKKTFVFGFCLILHQICAALGFLIPMDETQQNHLKAYGIAYWVLQNNVTVDWLLNYRGGSFLIQYSPEIKSECVIMSVFNTTIFGIRFDTVADVNIYRKVVIRISQFINCRLGR